MPLEITLIIIDNPGKAGDTKAMNLAAVESVLKTYQAILQQRSDAKAKLLDPLLLRIYRWGALLSQSGIVFAVIGVWRPSPLRWHAPACAIGTLLFWFAAAMGE